MDPIDHFRYSRAAKLHIRGTYKRPDSLAASLPATLMHQACVVKQFGSLDFSLDADALGWLAPFNFKIQAKTGSTVTWGSLSIVNWDLGQAVGSDFVTPNGVNVRIESVEAGFAGALLDRGTYEAAVGSKFEPSGAPCNGASDWQDVLVGGVFFFGSAPTWTFRIVVDGIPENVELALSQIWLDIGSISLPEIPFEALVSHIIFGGRLDNSGVVLGGPGIPPGPLPFRDAIEDVLLSLAGVKLAWAVHDPATRRRLQEAGVEGARASLDSMLRGL